MRSGVSILVASIVRAVLPLVLSAMLPAWCIAALLFCRLRVALASIAIVVAIISIVLLLLASLFDFILGVQDFQDFVSEFNDFVLFVKFSASFVEVL